MGKLKDLTGQKFGRLTVIKRVENDSFGQACWLCKCECDNEIIVSDSNLRRLRTKSCGCLRARNHAHTHNQTNTRLYRIWCGMEARCYNENTKDYKHYGKRGIEVCKE